MRKFPVRWAAGIAAIAAIPLAFQLSELAAPAADHLEPPQRTSPRVDATPDRAADIADLYAFHDNDSLTVIVTFAGPAATTEPAVYDPDVQYTINISNAAPRTTPDIPIVFQFGSDGSVNGDQFGIRVRNLPGTTGDLIGPVETNLSSNGVLVRAGLFDDPFFFDSQGFRETRDTGTLSFNSGRDFFADQNITAVVIEIPRDRVENDNGAIDIWGTSQRFGGQL